MARNLFVFSFLVWAVASFGRSAFGAETKLVEMTNEEDKDVTHFVLVTNDETKDAEAFIKRTFNPKGKKINEVKYNQEQVIKGLVMEHRKDRDIVILRSENFSAHQGGIVVIDTLFSGVSDKRKSYEFDLERNGDSWSLTYKDKKASRVHCVSNKAFLIGTVGIKDLVVK